MKELYGCLSEITHAPFCEQMVLHPWVKMELFSSFMHSLSCYLKRSILTFACHISKLIFYIFEIGSYTIQRLGIHHVV